MVRNKIKVKISNNERNQGDSDLSDPDGNSQFMKDVYQKVGVNYET